MARNSTEVLNGVREPSCCDVLTCRPVPNTRSLDIWAPLEGAISRKRHEDKRTFRAGHGQDKLCHPQDRRLARVTKVHWSVKHGPMGSKRDEAINKIVPLTERPCLHALAKEGQGRSLQGLYEEVANLAAIVQGHPGPYVLKM